MIDCQSHVFGPAHVNIAQIPAPTYQPSVFGAAIPILLFILCVGALILGLGKLFSNPEARKIGKIFLLLPLMVVGGLLLSFVVLMTVYWFAGIKSHGPFGIHVSDSGRGTDVRIMAGGPEIRVSDSSQGTEVNISANAASAEKSPPKPTPPQPQASGGERSSSGAAKVLVAVNRAFVTAVRSTFAKGPAPAARPTQVSEAVATAVPPAAASAPTMPSAVAVASSSGLEPAAVAAVPTPPVAPAAPTAAKRPDWIDNPPQPSADAYEVAVKAGPWKTRVECEQSLDEEIEWAVDSYVAWRIGEDARAEVGLPVDYARRHLVKDQWLEKINTSLGEMYNLHALLSFDRQVEGRLRDTWTGIVTAARLLLAAAVLGGALLLLSVIYGYLKIDLATGGAYRGRLRFAVVVILALAAAGAAVVSHAAIGAFQPPPEVNAKNV